MSLTHSYNINVSGGPAGIETSPRRRQTPNQPLNLTTSLGNARNAGLGIGGMVQTPISGTTLSSPFSAYPQTSYPQSPGGTMRGGASPMASRSGSGFSGHYNPQQWGAVNNVSPNSMSMAGEHRQTSQSSRTAHLAPVGPDGKGESCLTRTQLIEDPYRASRFSSTTIFTSSRSAISGLTKPHHLSCRYHNTSQYAG